MRQRIWAGVLVMAAGMACVIAFSQNRPLAAAADDEKAIQRATDAYAAAFNKGDLDGILAIWATDGEYVDESGKSSKGRDALAAVFKKVFEDNKGITIRLKSDMLRMLNNETALQEGAASFTYPSGETMTSRFSAVWAKKDGAWRLQLVHDSSGAREMEEAHAPIKDLSWLVGDWTHESKGAKTTLAAHWMKGEKFLILDYRVERNGEDALSIKQIIGWNPSSERLHSWVFDGRGGFGEGTWTRYGNTWEVDASGFTSDGREGSSTHKWSIVDENTFSFQSLNREIGDQAMPDVKVTYKRVKKSK